MLLLLQVLKAPHFTIGHIGSMGRGKCHAEMSADARFVAAGAADGQVRHTQVHMHGCPLAEPADVAFALQQMGRCGKQKLPASCNLCLGCVDDPLAELTDDACALLGLLNAGLCLCSATSAATCYAISSHTTLGANAFQHCCMH